MASRRFILQLSAAFLIAATVSSFTFVCADDSSKSDEKVAKEASLIDDSSTQDESKDKRSQEEIMFGNQQNKPNGLVDDLMEMSDNAAEEDNNPSSIPDKKSSDSQGGEQSSDDSSKNSKEEDKLTPAHDDDMMMESGSENWYNTIPVSTKAMQYLANSPGMKTLPSDDFPSGLYDQEDLYRRKRQLVNKHAMALHKRSLSIPSQDLYRRKRQLPLPLRSSLGQMIQKRGIRMPRRSMRLKRQVNVDDILNLLGNDRYYEEEPQMTPHIFGGRSQIVAKRRVPGQFSGYPETPAPEFRIPYVFKHHDDGLLTSPSDLEDTNEMIEDNNMDDINDLMLLPPTARYGEMGPTPFSSRDDEKEAFQKWLALHTIPSLIRVQRRSAPYFYPVDYRYIPGYKKRSVFSHGNRGSEVTHLSGGEEEEPESDFGKWGHVVQVPEAYASPEDIARLYGLAGLLAEEEESGDKKRRLVKVSV